MQHVCWTNLCTGHPNLVTHPSPTPIRCTIQHRAPQTDAKWSTHPMHAPDWCAEGTSFSGCETLALVLLQKSGITAFGSAHFIEKTSP